MVKFGVNDGCSDDTGSLAVLRWSGHSKICTQGNG